MITHQLTNIALDWEHRKGDVEWRSLEGREESKSGLTLGPRNAKTVGQGSFSLQSDSLAAFLPAPDAA